MSAKLHLFWRGLVALFLTLLVMFGTFKLWQWQVRVDTMPGVQKLTPCGSIADDKSPMSEAKARKP